MLERILFTSLALLFAQAAIGKNVPKRIDGAAIDLACRYCPIFLKGQFPLRDNERLKSLGIVGKVERSQDARFGDVEVVGISRTDGALIFGGAPYKGCRVIVMGPHRMAAMQKLRDNIAVTGLDFKPDAARTGIRGPFKVETFKVLSDGMTLRIEIVDHGTTAPIISVGIYGSLD